MNVMSTNQFAHIVAAARSSTVDSLAQELFFKETQARSLSVLNYCLVVNTDTYQHWLFLGEAQTALSVLYSLVEVRSSHQGVRSWILGSCGRPINRSHKRKRAVDIVSCGDITFGGQYCIFGYGFVNNPSISAVALNMNNGARIVAPVINGTFLACGLSRSEIENLALQTCEGIDDKENVVYRLDERAK